MFASTLSAWIGTLSGRANRRTRRSRPAARRPLAVESLETRAVPAVYNWLPTAPGNYLWSDANNWDLRSVPKSAGDEANVTSAAVGNQVISLSEAITVGTLRIGSSGVGTGGFTIVGNGNTLSFQDGDGQTAIVSQFGDGDAILAPVAFINSGTSGTGLTVTNNSTAPLSLFGPITVPTGTGTLSVAGTGPIAFPEGQAFAANVRVAGTGNITHPVPLFATSQDDSGVYAFDAGTGALLATVIAPSYAVGTTLSGPGGLTVGPDGNLYVSSRLSDTVLRFNLTTYTVSTFLTVADLTAARLGTNNPNPVFAPAGVRFGPDGSAFVALNGGPNATGNGAVIRFGTVIDAGGQRAYNGTFRRVAGGTDPTSPSFVPTFLQPTGLTFGTLSGDEASLYVSYRPDTGSAAVGRFVNVTDPDPFGPTFLGSAFGLTAPGGLVWGPDGNLYTADPSAVGEIFQYNSGGVFVRRFNQSSLAGTFPSDVAFDAQGRLLVAALGPNRSSTTKALAGEIDRLGVNGQFDRVLTSSGRFPATEVTAGMVTASGIAPAHLALLPTSGLPTIQVIPGRLTAGTPAVGTASPSRPGALTTGGVTLGADGTFAVTLAGTAVGTGYSRLTTTGPLVLTNAAGNRTALDVTIPANFTAPLGSQYVIVTAPTQTAGVPGITGLFELADGTDLTDGMVFKVGTGATAQQFRINYFNGTGGALSTVTLTRVLVPTITSANSFTFFTRLADAFTVVADGFPAPIFTASTDPGTGRTLADLGLSLNPFTGVISGSPLPGTAGAMGSMTYTFTITAGNGVPQLAATPPLTPPPAPPPTNVQTFTLTIREGVNAAFTSLPAFVVQQGTAGTFAVASTGTPVPTIPTSTGTTAGVALAGSPDPALSVTQDPTTLVYSVLRNGVATGITFTPATGTTADSVTGTLATTADTPNGVYALTFTATNRSTNTGTVLFPASQAFTLTVGTPPTITSPATVTFFTNRANQFTVTTNPDAFPIPLINSAGSLPAGLTITGALLSGTPEAGTESGSPYTLTLTATNALGTSPAQTFALVVQTGTVPVISAPDVQVVTGTAGTFALSATGNPLPTLTVTGIPAGTGIAYTQNFDSNGNPLGTGTLTTSATTPAGVYTLTATADNGVTIDGVGALPVTFTLTVGTPPTRFTTPAGAPLVFVAANQPANVQLASDATPVAATAFTVLSTSPDFDAFTTTSGLSVSAAGLLSGTPTATRAYSLVVRVANPFGSVDLPLTVTVTTPPTFPGPTGSATFTLNAPNSVSIAAIGSPAPTYSLEPVTGPTVPPTPASDLLPPGVTFDATTGVLSGTPTAGGTFPFVVRATNAVGSAAQTFTLTVNLRPTITSPNAVTFFTGRPNTFAVTSSGFPAPAITLAGRLPDGVTFDATTGAFTGSPTETGTFPLTITASNGVTPNAVQPFTLTVLTGVAPTFTSPDTVGFVAGVGGTFTVTATGTPAATLAAGALPDGVTFNPATGVLTVGPGVPVGNYGLTFAAANGIDPPATQAFTLSVNQAPAITSAAGTTFTAGSAGGFQVTTTGFPSATLGVSGALPAGVTFDPATGQFTGTPAAATGGVFPLTITAANSQATATQAFTLTVNQPPAFTSVASATVTGLRGGEFGVAATGFPAVTLAAQNLPAGVTFDPATGRATVSATTVPGVYPLTFTATSSAGQATQAFALTVTPPPTGPVERLAVGGRTDGTVALFDQAGGGRYNLTPTATIAPFGGFGANVRTAVADVNGDGVDDTIVVTGPGVPVQLVVISGVDNATLLVGPINPFAGSDGFTGGAFVAAGDFDLDGRADIVVTPDLSGGPRVVIFSLLPTGFVQRASFLGIDDANFRGGARPAVGDVNGDGRPDLVFMAGAGGGPRVAVFSGAALFGTRQKLVNDFFAFEPTLRDGAYAAVGDLNKDGFGELVFGAGPGGSPRVFALDGRTLAERGSASALGSPVLNFFVDGNLSARGGVRVATKAVAGTGDIALVVGSGEGEPSRVKVYPTPITGRPGEPLPSQTLDPFAQVLADGVFVG